MVHRGEWREKSRMMLRFCASVVRKIMEPSSGKVNKRSRCDGKMMELALEMLCSGFPGGAVVKNPPANAGDTGSSSGPGRSHMPWSN